VDQEGKYYVQAHPTPKFSDCFKSEPFLTGDFCTSQYFMPAQSLSIVYMDGITVTIFVLTYTIMTLN